MAAPAGVRDEEAESALESAAAALRDEEACCSSWPSVEGTGVAALVASGESGLNAESATRSMWEIAKRRRGAARGMEVGTGKEGRAVRLANGESSGLV